MRRTRWIAFLALLLALMLSCTALAAQGDANLGNSEEIQEKYNDYIRGACVLRDALYLYGNSYIFSYRVGDAELTAAEYALPEAEENEYKNLERLFSDGEDLYMLVVTQHSEEDYYGVESLEILPVEIDGEKVSLGEGVEADISELTTDYGDSDYEYLVQINDACCVGGYLMLFVYDGSGQENIYQMDLESGEGDYIELPEGSVAGIVPYEDGLCLIQSFDYEARTSEFYSYDPEEEELTSVCDPIQLSEYEYGLNNMAYSQESGKLFYLSNGYVMAMEDFDYEGAEQVAELSTMYSNNYAGLLLPGDYYVFNSYDNIAVRATDPEALPETRLVIKNNGYSDAAMDAYYAFGNKHGDVAVVLDSAYVEPSALVEAMMNRDDSVDIYTLSVDSQGYDAVYNRGYMAELTDPALTEPVGEMYPFIQDVLTKDGQVLAVPVNIYGWVATLDAEGFEKIGIPKEELPTNWKDLLALLPTLADKIPEDGSVYVFDEYNDQRSIRYQLYNALLDAWRTRLDATGQTQSYDDPELIEMMEAVQNLDLGALGVPEPEDDEGSVGYSVSYGGDRVYRLVQFSNGCTLGNFYGDFRPTPLSVLPGEDPWIPLSLTVAFVNPFSKHIDLAQEFLAELMNCLDEAAIYNLSDKYNEPVRDESMIRIVEEWKEELEKQKASLETAEEIDKPAIEESIAAYESMLVNQERYQWKISAEDIAWYRENAAHMTVQRFDYMNAGDDNQELYDMRQQMFDGKISPADFLREIDRKVRMRAMEGN